jgi:hypothetical protein
MATARAITYAPLYLRFSLRDISLNPYKEEKIMEDYTPAIKGRIGELEERISKIDRQNKNFKVIGVISLLLITILIITGTKAIKNKTVTAENFVIVDSEGEIRGGLGILPKDGEPALMLFGRGQKAKALLKMTPKGPLLTFYDEKEKARISASILDSGILFSLTNNEGKPSVDIAVASDGSPGMLLRDKNGKVMFAAPLK